MEKINKICENQLDLNQFFLDWKEAIEDVFYHNEWMREKMLETQLEIFRGDDLLKDLDVRDGEESIRLFHYFFAYKLFQKQVGLEKKLLRFCLIAGRYADYSEQELRQIKSELHHTIGLLDLTLLFERIFVKYEANRLLILNFHLFDRLQIEKLLQVLKGASPKTLFKDELELSKKEIRASYLLDELPYCLKQYEHTEEFFSRLLIYIRLLALDPEQSDFLWDYFRYHTIWEKDFTRFEREFDFWKQCYQFLLDHKDHPEFYGSSQYLDFIIYRKDNDLHEFRLYGRNIPNLNELMFAFNTMQHQIYLEEQLKIREATWESGPTLINQIQFKSRVIVFIELTSSKELIQEGEQMENCLMNYIEDCYRGWSKVLSVRDGKNILFDIELREKKVVQAYGKNNEPLSEELKEILTIWVKMNKLKVELNIEQ